MSVAPTRTMSRIFGVRLHDVPSVTQLRALCDRFLAGERTFRIFTPNPEILLLARRDPRYVEILNSADLALPDGTGVALVESVRSLRRVRRWPGVEIAALLLQLAAERGATVAFLGGSDGVTERAAARWREALPSVRIHVVGTGVGVGDDGRTWPAERDDELIDALRSTSPTVVMVGLGAPKQERWIGLHADAVPSARIMVGVGGTFDMWAGRLPRSPRVFHHLGLEWLWRLALEPRRVGRIARATIVFPYRALTDHADR